MGWFKKKGDESLSELPDLPELPEWNEQTQLSEDSYENPEEMLPQLPSYPNTNTGKKFSQNAIKDAVTGEKESDNVFSADEFPDDSVKEIQMMPEDKKTERVSITTSREKSIPKEFVEASAKIKKVEPIFIRIDKFEETLKTFEESKKKIMEIEKMLKTIQTVKEQEEKELNSWELEIGEIKSQIEKVDKEIFSKIQ